MIARLWSAYSTSTRAPAYADHLQSHVLPALRQVDGYAGADLLQRATGEGVEIIVITWWRSPEAIRGFAGPDAEQAVVADAAAALLTRFDRRVRHYDLIVEDVAGGRSTSRENA